MRRSIGLLVLFLSAGLAWLSCNKEAQPVRPNVLIVMGDDISFPHLGVYGTDWVRTPNCDRLAAEGLTFTNAYTPNPKCGPSRSILLTGRNGWQLGQAINHLAFWPDSVATIFEALGKAGYHTGFTGKGWAPGDPGDSNGKKRELVGPAYSQIKLTPPTTKISSIDYAANFGAFLRQRKAGKQFAFWYGALEPHRAYEFGTGVSLGGYSLAEIDEIPGYWPDTDSVRHDLLDYALEIEHFDHHLGRMLDTLAVHGELDNTLIIVTADNGMPFPRVKGQLYHDAHHLPFLIRFPAGIKEASTQVQSLVSFADVAPTLADYCQLESDALHLMGWFQGRSLRPLLEGKHPADWPDFALLGKERHDTGRPNDQGYPIRAIRQGDYLLIVNYKPDRWPAGHPRTGYLNTDASATKSYILHQYREGNDHYWQLNFGKRSSIELYNLAEDPHCLANLAQDPAHAAIIEKLRTKMENELVAQGDLRMAGRGHEYEAFPIAFPDQQQYYEKFVAGDTVKAGWIIPDDYEPYPLQETAH
ncbi:MAG: sulfatase [Bacteroidota bacterium]